MSTKLLISCKLTLLPILKNNCENELLLAPKVMEGFNCDYVYMHCK